jgi:hypothetical protein
MHVNVQDEEHNMELNEEWLKAVDRLRDGVDEEKVPRKVREVLEFDLEPEAIQTFADELATPAETLRDRAQDLETQANEIEEASQAIAAFGDAVVAAVDAVSDWEESTGADKRDARETLLEALSTAVDAFDDANSHDLESIDTIVADVDDEEGSTAKFELEMRVGNGVLVIESADDLALGFKLARKERLRCLAEDVARYVPLFGSKPGELLLEGLAYAAHVGLSLPTEGAAAGLCFRVACMTAATEHPNPPQDDINDQTPTYLKWRNQFVDAVVAEVQTHF